MRAINLLEYDDNNFIAQSHTIVHFFSWHVLDSYKSVTKEMIICCGNKIAHMRTRRYYEMAAVSKRSSTVCVS